MADQLISHVGIAVSDLSDAIAHYRLLTDSEPATGEVADQKVKIAMFPGDDHDRSRIELLAATSPDSPIAKHIERRGEGLHHLCVFVDDIDKKLAELNAAGVRLIDQTPRIGADGNRIAFVHPAESHGVLIELEERPR